MNNDPGFSEAFKDTEEESGTALVFRQALELLMVYGKQHEQEDNPQFFDNMGRPSIVTELRMAADEKGYPEGLSSLSIEYFQITYSPERTHLGASLRESIVIAMEIKDEMYPHFLALYSEDSDAGEAIRAVYSTQRFDGMTQYHIPDDQDMININSALAAAMTKIE